MGANGHSEREPFRALLISTYEMGRQPFGLASPAAWLRADGVEVECLDLSQQRLDAAKVRQAHLIAFYLPMHTATRIATAAIRRTRELNPRAHYCAYGLYAPMNEELLRQLGVSEIIGGEFEAALAETVRQHHLETDSNARSTPGSRATRISLDRQQFVLPHRAGLPALSSYAGLLMPDGSKRIVGYTEASRGCKHLCRHCPIVPIYRGQFRIVQRDVVLEDIRQQVASGAQHITFGDPDFFNGPAHAIDLVGSLHHEFPGVSYDVTIKIEHLLQHAKYLPTLRDTGCAFVTSAVESLDDRVLDILQKGHTRAGFLRVVDLFERIGLVLAPTFVAFHPWTTLQSYREFLETIANLGLIEHVAPVQLCLRLLIPSGSLMLEVPEIRPMLGGFDQVRLTYPWTHPDPRVDALQARLEKIVHELSHRNAPRQAVFDQVWRAARATLAGEDAFPPIPPLASRSTIPYLTEPWYC